MPPLVMRPMSPVPSRSRRRFIIAVPEWTMPSRSPAPTSGSTPQFPRASPKEFLVQTDSFSGVVRAFPTV